jgi:hypothetical protein
LVFTLLRVTSPVTHRPAHTIHIISWPASSSIRPIRHHTPSRAPSRLTFGASEPGHCAWMWRAGGRGKQAAAGAPSTDRPHPRTHGNGNCRQARTNVPTPLGHSTLPPARAVSSSPTTRSTPLAPAADPARFDARGGVPSPGPQNTPRLITDAMSRPVLVNRAPARPCWGQADTPKSPCIDMYKTHNRLPALLPPAYQGPRSSSSSTTTNQTGARVRARASATVHRAAEP